jgi:hypothetical protein
MNLSDENKLLLLCAQAKIPENKLDQVKHLLSLPLNWNKILESGFSQAIAPLLYNSLKGIQGKQYIPREVMDKLKNAYHNNIARNMYLYVELLRILKAFNKREVKVIVLKGATLAKFIYGDIGLRSMSDIDLLVKKEDLSRAKKIMSDLNYVPKSHIFSDEWFEKNHYHLPTYINREKSLMVEIHWHITGKSFDLNIKKWFKRAKYTKLDGCPVLIPAPEDMIIHLCLHLYNHGYDSKMILRELCDISETLNHYRDEINWLLFQNEIDDYGLYRPVYSVLHLLKKFHSNVDIPLQIQCIESSHINLKLLRILEKRMFIDDGIFSAIPGGLIKSLTVNRTREKLRLLFPIVFPPREVISKRYLVSSYSKIYFYYLIRPFRLLIKYGKHLLTIHQTKIIRND